MNISRTTVFIFMAGVCSLSTVAANNDVKFPFASGTTVPSGSIALGITAPAKAAPSLRFSAKCDGLQKQTLLPLWTINGDKAAVGLTLIDLPKNAKCEVFTNGKSSLRFNTEK